MLDFYAGDHRPLYLRSRMTKDAFTYELSDHLPLWIQVDTDVEGEEQVVRGRVPALRAA